MPKIMLDTNNLLAFEIIPSTEDALTVSPKIHLSTAAKWITKSGYLSSYSKFLDLSALAFYADSLHIPDPDRALLLVQVKHYALSSYDCLCNPFYYNIAGYAVAVSGEQLKSANRLSNFILTSI
jgi:hypothetical protein